MNKVLDYIDFYVYVLIAFLIPVFSKAIPILIVFLILTTFLRISTYKNLFKLLKSIDFYILIAPFLLIVIGYFYSTNRPEAFVNIETGSSLIIFPFILYFSRNNHLKEKFNWIFKAFVISVLFSYVILWVEALPKYLENGDAFFLYYTSFSKIIKTPNHLSYNVLFAVVIVLLNLFGIEDLLIKKRSKFSIFINLFLFLVLSVYLFQLVAKSTIFIYLLIILLVLAISYYKKIIKTYALATLLIFVIGLSLSMLAIPRVKTRFTNLIELVVNRDKVDYTQQESSTMRFSAMKSSVEIIKENWLIGVGPGDVVDELELSYERNNFRAAECKHTNPHNQFLRSFLMSGIFGLISLILIFYILFRNGIKKKSVLAFLWSFIMLIIFLVDDMFIFRDGVVYFAFFTSYFIFIHPKSKAFIEKNNTISSQT